MQIAQENIDQQTKDSNIIFTAISTGAFDNYEEAERAVTILYGLDMSFSRAGISHALERLRKFYNKIN